jgi:hypothetical protein
MMEDKLKHFIKVDKYSKQRANDTGGDYYGGFEYQRAQVKKRGPATCKKCGKSMPTVPKGWADYCYDCTE